MASCFYRLGLSADRFLRSRQKTRLPKPVISIGNITLGGTGKTPLLIRLVQDLQKKQQTPAILTRGYGGLFHSQSPSQILNGHGAEDKLNLNDETLLVSRECPGVVVGVGSHRVQMAEKVLANHKPDQFILDDGFQHWPIHRNWDVVCVDATDPWGGGHLVPWGRLREPLVCLKRAHIVVLTRCDLVAESALTQIQENVQQLNPKALLLKAQFKLEPFDEPLDGKTVLAVSAIGNPAAFELALKNQGATVVSYPFPDHYTYKKEDMEKIQQRAKKENALVVTTEKDWIKMQDLGSFPFHVARGRIHFDEKGEQDWNQWLNRVINEEKN